MNFITCTKDANTPNGSCRIIQFVSVHNSEIHCMSIMSATNENNKKYKITNTFWHT